MGIFDDAIRQHLDLKRRQGADENRAEAARGRGLWPAARPGDPDFPETGESAVAEKDSEAAVAVEPEAPPEPETKAPEPEPESPPKAEPAD